MADEIQPVTELWMFGGSRVDGKGKRVHAWYDVAGNEMLFKASGSYTVGSLYAAQVTRTELDRVTRHGTPIYHGRSENEYLRGLASARHRSAELQLATAARERADKKEDPVEVAIDQLGELVKHIPRSQRAAFAAYVAHRLAKY